MPKLAVYILVFISGAIILLGAFIFVRGRNVLPAATDKLLNAQTFHVVSELTINLPAKLRGADRPFTKITARLNGATKRASSGTPELTGALLLEARGRGNVFFADGQTRILADRVLFNLDNLPVFLNPSGSLVHRWTEVSAPLLTTNNPAQVREVLAASLGSVRKVGTETIDEQRLTRYSGSFNEEQEQQLADVLRQGTSGNRAAHVIARLLDANRVEALDIWVDSGAQEIRHLRVHFVRPLSNGNEFDFATLTLTFTDYGKSVAIDEPQRQARVRPEVFAKIFGSGDIQEVKTQEEQNNE